MGLYVDIALGLAAVAQTALAFAMLREVRRWRRIGEKWRATALQWEKIVSDLKLPKKPPGGT